MNLVRHKYLIQTKLTLSETVDNVFSEHRNLTESLLKPLLSSIYKDNNKSKIPAIGLIYTNHICAGYVITELSKSIHISIAYAYAILQNKIKKVIDASKSSTSWSIYTTLTYGHKNKFDKFDIPILFIPDLNIRLDTEIEYGRSKNTKLRFVSINYRYETNILPFITSREDLQEQNRLRGYIMQCNISRPLSLL